MNTDRPTSSIQQEIEALRQACAILEREALALRTLDLAAIDRAREEKLEIDRRLNELLSTRRRTTADPPTDSALHAQHRDLCARVREQAQRNQLRLEAVHGAIRGLLQALRGSAQSVYGRAAAPAPQPVLTSCIE